MKILARKSRIVGFENKGKCDGRGESIIGIIRKARQPETCKSRFVVFLSIQKAVSTDFFIVFMQIYPPGR